MALVPVVPSGAVWIASLTLPWGYAVLGDPADHGVPRWLSVAAYAPVYLALAVGLWRWKRRSMSKDIIA